MCCMIFMPHSFELVIHEAVSACRLVCTIASAVGENILPLVSRHPWEGEVGIPASGTGARLHLVFP